MRFLKTFPAARGLPSTTARARVLTGREFGPVLGFLKNFPAARGLPPTLGPRVLNGGEFWQKLPGTPTISFRDLVIQQRENDLVAASFGRGFFVLDDYSALREMVNKDNLSVKGKLFKPRDAKLFKQRNALGNTGGQYYVAENPTFGAVFTYHLKDAPETIKSKRKKIR